jgi:hypothetical protein
MMQSKGTFLVQLPPAAFLLLVLLAACPFRPAASQEEKGGLLRVTIAGGAEQAAARTLFPDLASLSYTLTFTSQEHDQREWTIASGSGAFALPPGLWNLAIAAKSGGTAVASGNAANILLKDGGTADAAVTLEPLAGGANGILAWSVEYPAGIANAVCYLNGSNGSPAAGFPLDLSSITPNGAARSGTVSLAPGSFLLSVRLINDGGGGAGETRAIHIYSGMTTMASYIVTSADFSEGADGFPPVILAADAAQNAYPLIASKGYGYEGPDQANGGHAGTAHITQEYNAELGKDVFAFAMHHALDGNATGDQTRQRIELKVDQNEYRGNEGRSFVYRWKFRLPADFAPSTEFTHIHQIKNEGGDASAPVITLTPRLTGGAKRMQLIYRPPTYQYGEASPETSQNRILKQVSLNEFLGEWVQAEEHVSYSADTAAAEYRITITRMRDGQVLLSYTHSAEQYAALESNSVKWPFVTWRPSNNYGRPKYGLYRLIWLDANLSISVAGLKDETILFADFEMERVR